MVDKTSSSKEQMLEKLNRLETYGCNYVRHVQTMIEILEEVEDKDVAELERLLQYSGPCLEQMNFAMQSIVRRLKDAEAELMVI